MNIEKRAQALLEAMQIEEVYISIDYFELPQDRPERVCRWTYTSSDFDTSCGTFYDFGLSPLDNDDPNCGGKIEGVEG